VPPVGGGDHVRGSGPELILYVDLACPACAQAWAELRELPLRLCLRHFPLASKRPRSPALHAAAEATSRQSKDAFWAMVDSLFADRGHVDDPHLWERVRGLGLDLERFERERRSGEVAARVRADFEGGIRAGVVATPSLFAGGDPLGGDLASQLGSARAL